MGAAPAGAVAPVAVPSADGRLEEAAHTTELARLMEAHSSGWVARMRGMRPIAQGLLLFGRDPSTVDPDALLREQVTDSRLSLYALSDYRGARSAFEEDAAVAVQQERALLSPSACAALRRALDLDGSTSVDSVEALTNHDLILPQVRQLP
jgi:hypothetical protein